MQTDSSPVPVSNFVVFVEPQAGLNMNFQSSNLNTLQLLLPAVVCPSVAGIVIPILLQDINLYLVYMLLAACCMLSDGQLHTLFRQ